MPVRAKPADAGRRASSSAGSNDGDHNDKAMRRHRVGKKARQVNPGGAAEQHEGDDRRDTLSVPPEGYEENENLLQMEIPPPPEPVEVHMSGARLVITHIDVENFKSFYGRQTIGPFHKNFTAVIGPNGSGKSNVIDSLLFVFGYRAAKIRSKKLASLIHSSTGRENVASCTVTVHLQKIVDKGRNDFDVVEGSRLTFSRTAYRDSTSKYLLNGRTIQFKEITERLRVAGIDIVHNRFLILQGEVEQISLMKPMATTANEDGMLEYLEEIVGSHRFKLPIDKLRHKLSLIDEKRGNQVERVKHAEKEKQDVETEARGVVDELRVDNAISLLTNKLLCVKKLNLSNKIIELNPEREIKQTLLGEAKNSMKEIAEKTKESKEKREAMQSDVGKRLEALNTASDQLRDAERKLTKANCDLEKQVELKQKLQDDLESEEKKIADYESLPARAQERINELKTKIDDSDQAIQESSEQLERNRPTVEARTSSLVESKKKLEAEISEFTPREDQIGSELVLAQGKLQNLQRDEETQRAKHAELTNRLAGLEEECDTKTRTLRDGKEAMPALEAQLQRASEESAKLAQREKELLGETRELQTNLEQNRQSAEAVRVTSQVLAALMREKSSGRIPGIYGRLGDLGAIDANYDLAISAAMGSTLDHIVVDTVETAQIGIQFLKRENLGRTSFIVLDKQQYLWPRIRDIPKTPENLPRLFDLIRVEDERMRPAFYMVIYDTLVAGDINTAKRVGYEKKQRSKVVTLEGEIVDTSGAMTGGGGANAIRGGKIGRKVMVNTKDRGDSAKDIRQLQTRLEEAQAELASVKTRLSEVSREAEQKRDEYKRMDRTLSAIEKVELKNLQDSIANTRNQLRAQEAKLQASIANPEEVRKVKEDIERLMGESAKLGEKGDALRLQLADVEAKITAITEEVIGRYQKSLREAEEGKKSAEMEIAKQGSAISLNDRNIKKTRERKANHECDLRCISGKIEELERRQVQLAEQIDKSKAAVESHKEEAKAIENSYKEIVSRDKGLDDEEVDMQRRIKSLEEELKGIETKINSLQVKMGELNRQVAKLRIYHFGDAIQFRQPEAELELGEGEQMEVEVDENEQIIRQELDYLERGQRQADTTSNSGEPMDTDENTGELTGETTGLDEEELELNEGGGREQRAVTGQSLNDYKRRVPVFARNIVSAFVLETLQANLAKLEKVKQSRKKPSNLKVVMDYLDRVRRYDREQTELQKILHERDQHRELCENLRKQRLQEFMGGYREISERLKEMYQMITLGGDASLDLVNSLDPFSEGISFAVRPPKKSWKQIANLSGGEKTLASLSLILALHHYRPSPFYVMDEIDAALDYRNVSIASHLIKERTQDAQFIIISLRNNMFENGDRIVGIFKVNDCTRNVVVDNDVRRAVEAPSA